MHRAIPKSLLAILNKDGSYKPDNDTLLNYGVRRLPLTFLVNPRGELLSRYVGPIQPDQIEGFITE